jgi:hypothetical protein
MKPLTIAFSLFLLAPSAVAQSPRYGDGQPEDSSVQKLIDELTPLIDQAERRRAADPGFLQDLRQVLAGYSWPWTVELLHDDFRDGDYTRNPSWKVGTGQFEVRRGVLYTTAESQAPTQAERPAQPSFDLEALLGTLLERYEQQQKGTPPEQAPELAEIYVTQRIPNAFAITLKLGSRSEEGRLEFGPYPGTDRSVGYRLGYIPGGRPALELLRVTSRGSAVIEAYNQPLSLEDGKPHTLQWTRNREGEMRVLLDGKELMRTTDRGLQDNFAGFTLANLAGDYAIDEVTLQGMK